jgi:N-acetyl-anhydromuramyl-L-alanine amidase AmpD
MKTNDQTTQQIQRFFHKIAQKFPVSDNITALTDIHVRASQDSGELLAFNDDDEEITRCVIEQWIDNKDDDFYEQITVVLRNELKKMHTVIDNIGILKPYSFVLEDDDKDNIAELYLADDDTVIIGGDLMQDLDKDLDSFFDDLMKE